MPIHKISCPACQAVLKSPQPIPPGKKVRCPKCQESFVTPKPDDKTAEIEAVQPAAAVKPPAVKPPPRQPFRDAHEAETKEIQAGLPRPRRAEDAPAAPRRARDDEAAVDEVEPARSADVVDDEEDSGAPDDDRPVKKKNLGLIMAAIGGGSFVGMIVFMVLSTVFAVSAMGNAFPKQFPGNPGMKFDPQAFLKGNKGDNAKEMEDFQNKLKAQMEAALAKDGPKGNEPPPNATDKISREAYEQVQLGGRFDDVEKMLGPGERALTTAVPKLANAAEEKLLTRALKDARVNLLYKWDGGENRIVVGIATAETGDINVFKGFFWRDKGKQRGVFQMDRSKAP